MTRRFLPFAALGLVAVLFYWGMLTQLRQREGGAPQVRASLAPTAPLDCESVCLKIAECNVPEWIEDCPERCQTAFGDEFRICVMETACDLLEEECAYPALDECREVCGKLSDCGILEPEPCLSACLEFESDTRECILVNDCEGIPEECAVFSREDQCGLYCERLARCGFWEEEGTYECMEVCREEGRELIECVLESPCGSIESWCFGAVSNPHCGAYCDKLMLCGQLDGAFYEGCMEGCAMEGESLVECVLEAECPFVDGCFVSDQTAVDCTAFCDLMIQCGQWEEETYQECMAECAWEIPERIACALEAGCERMDACFEEASFECIAFCNRLINCRELAVEEMEDCLAGCAEEPMEVVDCVLNQECGNMTYCFDESPGDAICGSFCDRMEICGRISSGEYENCLDLCAGQSPQRIECVLESPCNRIGGCLVP